jgi:hypothetical protein
MPAPLTSVWLRHAQHAGIALGGRPRDDDLNGEGQGDGDQRDADRPAQGAVGETPGRPGAEPGPGQRTRQPGGKQVPLHFQPKSMRGEAAAAALIAMLVPAAELASPERSSMAGSRSVPSTSPTIDPR